jgi:uncharacterized membrane-anchored protein YhcB (DUF1043 family)
MELIEKFAESGVLGLILGVVFVFVLLPLFNSYRKNIDKQTEVLSKMSEHLDEIRDELRIMKDELRQLKHRRQ